MSRNELNAGVFKNAMGWLTRPASDMPPRGTGLDTGIRRRLQEALHVRHSARDLLFFAAWPMLAACVALYMLRDLDTFATVEKPRAASRTASA
jgi:hypothetical protein